MGNLEKELKEIRQGLAWMRTEQKEMKGWIRDALRNPGSLFVPEKFAARPLREKAAFHVRAVYIANYLQLAHVLGELAPLPPPKLARVAMLLRNAMRQPSFPATGLPRGCYERQTSVAQRHEL